MMMQTIPENPFQSSTKQTDDATYNDDNVLAKIGFALSLTGVISLFLVGPFGPVVSTAGMLLAFLCLPGLILSGFAVFHRNNRLAKWGIGLGMFGSLYLPAFCLYLSWLQER